MSDYETQTLELIDAIPGSPNELCDHCLVSIYGFEAKILDEAALDTTTAKALASNGQFSAPPGRGLPGVEWRRRRHAAICLTKRCLGNCESFGTDDV